MKRIIKPVQEIEGLLKLAGIYDTIQFTPNGIAGIFALYTLPGANLRDVFMNEFFVVCLSTQKASVRLLTHLNPGFLPCVCCYSWNSIILLMA